MAVKIRLKRMGAKKRPFYRIVVADSRSPRDGRFIEVVGTYNPIPEKAEITLKEESIMNWLSKGAIPTDTVRSILSKNGIMEKFAKTKKKKAPKKSTKKVEKKVEKKETEKVEKKPVKKTTTKSKTTTKKEGK